LARAAVKPKLGRDNWKRGYFTSKSNMAEKGAGKSDTEKRINFSVLKKLDPDIDKIIDTASSVAHYVFNSSSGVWVSCYLYFMLIIFSQEEGHNKTGIKLLFCLAKQQENLLPRCHP